jgi:hypothetical protein
MQQSISLVNVLLLVASFAGAIVAFGGDTWSKGRKPLVQRVTARGWSSIVFLTIALALGLTKESLTATKELLSKKDDEKKESEGKERERVLQGKLDGETGRLQSLQVSAGVTTNQLTLTSKALADNKKVVAGVALLEKQTHSQVDKANLQISVANQSLEKSGQVLSAISGLPSVIT